MGEAGLHTRLSCTCQVCITWRRCGILLENCHQDTPYFQLALRALRQCASELLDHLDLRAAGVQPPVAVGGCPPPAPPKREGVGAEAPPVQGGTVPEEKPGGEEKTAVAKEEKKKRFRKKKRPRPNQRRPARRKQEKPVQRKIRVGKTGPEEEKGRERSEAEAGVAGGEVVSQSDPARK